MERSIDAMVSIGHFGVAKLLPDFNIEKYKEKMRKRGFQVKEDLGHLVIRWDKPL